CQVCRFLLRLRLWQAGQSFLRPVLRKVRVQEDYRSDPVGMTSGEKGGVERAVRVADEHQVVVEAEADQRRLDLSHSVKNAEVGGVGRRGIQFASSETGSVIHNERRARGLSYCAEHSTPRGSVVRIPGFEQDGSAGARE